ncbi:unnamed protein product [Absidia cylindrospora]
MRRSLGRIFVFPFHGIFIIVLVSLRLGLLCMGKRSSISESKHIATVSGWEDGKHYERPVTKLDRWELQLADRLVIHMDGHDIVLVQDPHSNHLGGYIWLSSIVFCSYLVSLHNGMHKGRGHCHEWIHMDHSKRWVELGSGVGLIGLMLHRLGVENVIVTDIEELLPIIEKNVEANDILVQSISGRRSNEKSMELCSSMPTAVVVEPLLWNDDDAIYHVKSAGPIDYIVACDCIYSEASAVDLVLTMDKLAGPDTIIICLSEVRNQAAQDTFMEQAKSLFTVDLIPPVQWQKKIPGVEFDATLNLYRLHKPSATSPTGAHRRHGRGKKTTIASNNDSIHP